VWALEQVEVLEKNISCPTKESEKDSSIFSLSLVTVLITFSLFQKSLYLLLKFYKNQTENGN
jgi:hypothetical protein